MSSLVKEEKVTIRKQFEDENNRNRIANAKYFDVDGKKGNQNDYQDPDSKLKYAKRQLDLILPDPAIVRSIELLVSNQSDGDFISVEMIDGDSAPIVSPGSILDTPVRKRFLNSQMELQKEIEIGYDREVPAGTIIRINYFILGGKNVTVKSNYDLKRKAI